MSWIALDKETQLEDIDTSSATRPQLIFKHSIRCSISAMIKNRLTKKELPDGIDFYYLDLVNHRDISNAIAHKYGVEHESPQVLLIKNGQCVYHASHGAIVMDDIVAEAM